MVGSRGSIRLSSVHARKTHNKTFQRTVFAHPGAQMSTHWKARIETIENNYNAANAPTRSSLHLTHTHSNFPNPPSALDALIDAYSNTVLVWCGLWQTMPKGALHNGIQQQNSPSSKTLRLSGFMDSDQVVSTSHATATELSFHTCIEEF